MSLLADIKESVLHLIFPHVCEGCGSDQVAHGQFLCLRCFPLMPLTNFPLNGENPIDKIFWGRMPVQNATALYYFTKGSLMQTLLHQFKYKNNKALGFWLGNLIGEHLAETEHFKSVEALIPLPLHKIKERKRGFNQSVILCKGMAEVMQIPVLENIVVRKANTESQTRKNRTERWQNMEDRFELIDASAIEGKHVLLADDVITTGATLEACGRELLKAPGARLSIATLCFSSGN